MQGSLYITKHYLKFFIIILLALTLFFIGLDFLQSSKDLPDSANLQLLYIMYKTFYAMSILLPIALIFALITTKLFMIRSNALVAFYSIGYSKKAVLKPFFLSALCITFIYILLNFTPFSYAKDYADNISKQNNVNRATTDLFFKYEDFYIYFEKLYPLQQRAQGIRIFKVSNFDLEKIMSASSAEYRDDFWYISNVKQLYKPSEISFFHGRVVESNDREIKMLEGFKPKILDQVYEGDVSFTILDAIEAILLLSKQDVNVDKMKTSLYSMVFYPLFAPFLIIIIFYFVPISARNVNINMFAFASILFSLLLWGLLFSFSRLSYSGTLSPEVGILLPTAVVILASVIFWFKKA